MVGTGYSYVQISTSYVSNSSGIVLFVQVHICQAFYLSALFPEKRNFGTYLWLYIGSDPYSSRLPHESWAHSNAQPIIDNQHGFLIFIPDFGNGIETYPRYVYLSIPTVYSLWFFVDASDGPILDSSRRCIMRRSSGFCVSLENFYRYHADETVWSFHSLEKYGGCIFFISSHYGGYRRLGYAKCFADHSSHYLRHIRINP